MLSFTQITIIGVIFFINMWYYRKLLIDTDIKQRIYTSFVTEFGDEIYKQKVTKYANRVMWYMILLPLMPFIAGLIYLVTFIKERKK
jgi:hypothetical protein